MSNLIHDFPLNLVSGYSFTRKEVKIDGHETDKGKLIALMEMFSRAAHNVLYKERPSGPSYIMDLTSDQRNMRICNFDTEELITGWYALKSISYSPKSGKIGHYPYRITLLYIGTLAGYQQWYALQTLESVTNDWGI